MHAILIATAALVGLPVLLHLIMKQEPKRLLFPAIRFLEKRRKINQRKLRLRHWLLLALRMLLIGLFGLALFQPTIAGSLGGLNFAGEQPVAAVFVLDTSPSMGYLSNGRTRLAEAKRRALELLDDLPSTSKVAVLDPAEPGGTWELSVADARKKLDELKDPRGTAVPVTTALAAAYQLFRTVDQETEGQEPMPRLVAVFSDRAAACWDASRTEDLTKLRETIPQPPVAHLFLDVGIDQPANVAVTAVEVKPQIVPKDSPVVVNVTVAAAGEAVEPRVVCKLPTADNAVEAKLVKVPGGGSAGVTFTFDGRKLKPGLHQLEVRLETPDNLDADNVRYFTFKVAEPRKVLTLVSDPRDAESWLLANDAQGEFVCDVRKATDELPSLTGYEAVCLLGVLDPGPLWEKLAPYVEAGGQLLVMPGTSLKPDAYRGKTESAARLLPGFLKETDAEVDLGTLPANDKRQAGVAWQLDDDAYRHPLIAPFRDWKRRGDIDFLQPLNPRLAYQFWAFDPAPGGGVVVFYADSDDPKQRHPAVLERGLGARRGRVLLLTTPMDHQAGGTKSWNNYWGTETSWTVVFPNLLLRYLCGDPADANFNFLTGQPVAVPLPKGDVKKGTKLQLEGRGVSGRDAEIELADGQTEVRLPPARTAAAGHVAVSLGDWRDGFSLNVPADESNLAKVSEDAIEGLLGPKSVVPLSRDVKLRDVLTTKFNQPIDLFPWLLIAVLLLLCLEGLLANRFYRKP